MLLRLLFWIVEWYQRRCTHQWAAADLLEGGSKDYAVRWCNHCGAVALDKPSEGEAMPSRCGEWRIPHATWEYADENPRNRL